MDNNKWAKVNNFSNKEKAIENSQGQEFEEDEIENSKSHGHDQGQEFEEEKSVEMPANYSIMLIMALIPPLWFFVMDKKIHN